MKYIVFLDGTATVFADTASHKQIAAGRAVRSAGFCRVETYRNQFDDIRAKIQVWGKSDTLQVSSNKEDIQFLEEIFRQ